eukprot:4274338-Pleurochrysis_carterae.AAC.1
MRARACTWPHAPTRTRAHACISLLLSDRCAMCRVVACAQTVAPYEQAAAGMHKDQKRRRSLVVC